MGTAKRDKREDIDILDTPFTLERIGTNGDLKQFGEMFAELDGKVDALGVGGADIYVVVGKRRYAFRQILNLTKGAKITPVVDGSGLKHTLEREAIRTLQCKGTVDFSKSRVLLVSAVDRFGMAQALLEAGAKVTFGDLPFGIGINWPLHTAKQLETFGAAILPIVTRLPFKWFYPTGEKQEVRTPKFGSLFNEAEIIAGDWHYIRRFAPDNLTGKTILTQTLRTADLDWLKNAGAERAITTTPIINGETFATNVMEGVVVTLLDKRPDALTDSDYLGILARLNWEPNVINLAS